MSEIDKDAPAPFRLPTGGRIDRDSTLQFVFGGRSLTGHPGDTLASALLANGVHQTGTSVKLGRPRGIAAAWAEDPNSVVQVEEPFPEPMLLATTIELTDGLVAHGLPGQGRLAEVADSARYDARHVHTDLLVVGAGPTGLSAALTAARAGARVVVVDDQSEAGGSLLGSAERIDDGPALDWVQRATAELAGFPDVLHLQRTTAFGHFDDGFVLALERRTDHLGGAAPRNLSRQRVWRIRAQRVLVATGAHERPIVFADNDRPGIMLAGAARTFLHRYGVLAGRAAVVFTCDDSAYAAAVDLADAGVEVRAVVDARPRPPAVWRAACASRGIPVLAGEVVTATEGVERVSAALVAPLVDGVPGRSDRIECDLLLVSGGWNPAVHLFSQAGGKLRYDAALGAFLPAEPLATTTVAGSAAGVFDLAGCLVDGHRASVTATDGLGVDRGGDVDLPRVAEAPERTPTAVMWRVPDTDGASRSRPVRRPAARRHCRRHRAGGRRGPAHGRAHQALHDDRNGARPGQDLRRHRLRRRRRAPAATRRGARHHHVPAAVHPRRLRRARRTRPRVVVRPRAHHRDPRLAPRAGRGLGGRRPVEAPALLPAAR